MFSRDANFHTAVVNDSISVDLSFFEKLIQCYICDLTRSTAECMHMKQYRLTRKLKDVNMTDTVRWRRGVAVTSLGVSTKLLCVGPG